MSARQTKLSEKLISGFFFVSHLFPSTPSSMSGWNSKYFFYSFSTSSNWILVYLFRYKFIYCVQKTKQKFNEPASDASLSLQAARTFDSVEYFSRIVFAVSSSLKEHLWSSAQYDYETRIFLCSLYFFISNIRVSLLSFKVRHIKPNAFWITHICLWAPCSFSDWRQLKHLEIKMFFSSSLFLSCFLCDRAVTATLIHCMDNKLIVSTVQWLIDQKEQKIDSTILFNEFWGAQWITIDWVNSIVKSKCLYLLQSTEQKRDKYFLIDKRWCFLVYFSEWQFPIYNFFPNSN